MPKEQTPEKIEEVQTPTSTNSELLEAQAQIAAMKKELTDPEYLAFKTAQKAPKPETGDIKFDEMSNSELMDFVLKAINMSSKQSSENLAKQIQDLKLNFGRFAISSDIKETKEQVKDFDKYQDAMAKLAKQMPGLSALRYYQMAVADSVMAKQNQAPEVKTETPEPEIPPETVVKEATNKTEAGELAWDKVVGEGKKDLDHLPLTEHEH